MWQRDQWRGPPYPYKREFMMRIDKQPRVLRPARAAERERLAFLGIDFTRYALNAVQAKAEPQALKDAHRSLIGSSFHAGVVALLLAPHVRSRGLSSLSRRRQMNSSNECAFSLVMCMCQGSMCR